MKILIFLTGFLLDCLIVLGCVCVCVCVCPAPIVEEVVFTLSRRRSLAHLYERSAAPSGERERLRPKEWRRILLELMESPRNFERCKLADFLKAPQELLDTEKEHGVVLPLQWHCPQVLCCPACTMSVRNGGSRPESIQPTMPFTRTPESYALEQFTHTTLAKKEYGEENKLR